jgi:hypothetical protein
VVKRFWNDGYTAGLTLAREDVLRIGSRNVLIVVQKESQDMISSRFRITAIPALIAAGATVSAPLAFKAAAHQAESSPEAAANPFADLGLPEIELHFTSADFTGMPESLEAGRYLVIAHGEPTEEDWGLGPTFVQLPEGMTLDDVLSIDPSTLDGPPEWYYQSHAPGGPVVLHATGATTAYGVVDLRPGEWIVAGNALAQPPIEVTVTGEMPADLPEPEANVTLTIGEMIINITEGAFVVGQNVVKVENIGAQPHFVEVDKVPDGTTDANLEATIVGFLGGTPEAEPLAEEDMIVVGFSGEQSGQTTQWSIITLQEPGTHAATCWIPDPETMLPHAAMGMHTVFEAE